MRGQTPVGREASIPWKTRGAQGWKVAAQGMGFPPPGGLPNVPEEETPEIPVRQLSPPET